MQASLDAGDSSAALALCRARIDAAPDDANARRLLALLLAGAGDLLPAERAARRACELAPEDPRCWNDLGRVCAMAGRHDDAALSFAEALELDPRHTDAWHNLGAARRRTGDIECAFAALKQALLLDSTRADTYLVLGNLLVAADQLEDAVECFERAARHDPKLAAARSRLAQQLSAGGKVRRAEALFRQSLGLNPDHLEGWLGLGRTLEDLGESEAACGCYVNVLRRCPGHALALGALLALARDEDAAEWLPLADAALAGADSPPEARALIGYGLAKHHDKRRDWSAAATAGRAANAARREKAGPLDRAALTARIDGLIATCTREFFFERRRFGLGNDQPVFIVGLPRSGTTLTEQILSSHPRLHGAGELPSLARIAARSVADDQEPWQAAAVLTRESSGTCAREYLDALRDGAPRRRLRYSDKSPLNFFHLAFAALLFPNARVVHCIREPRDNALSIWMENFNAEQRYATDFDDLAFFHAQYQRLMTHWREVLPLPMLELRYEETVADLEGRAKKLIAFLGAPWDARCLDFHRHERAVQTPSRWQVRQPIYTKSVARWQHYAPHLPELVAAFGDAGPCRSVHHE